MTKIKEIIQKLTPFNCIRFATPMVSAASAAYHAIDANPNIQQDIIDYGLWLIKNQ